MIPTSFPCSRPWLFSRATARGAVVRAFTMVELLVVISIIILLAGLSFPLVQSVRKKSLVVSDISKMRSIGTALALYANDNDQRLPNDSLSISGTESVAGQGDRWNWHECVDRYFDGKVPTFNASSIYNHTHRKNSPFWSKASRAYPGFRPTAEQSGPFWLSFNPNVNDNRWDGYFSKMPRRVSIVVAGETCHGGGEMRPQTAPTYADNVESRYRVSRPGNSALYLFADFHVETLTGDRSYDYYKQHPEQPNIWRWW